MATALAENQFESPISTQEMLARSPLGHVLLPAYEIALKADPRVGNVQLVAVELSEDTGLGYARPMPGGEAEVHFRLDDTGAREVDSQMRLPLTLKHIAKEVGLEASEVSPGLIAQFVFLHEIGHSIEFINNSDDLEALSAQYDAELMQLPIPGWTPRKVRSEKGRKFIESHWEYLSKNLGVATFDELYERQFNGFKNVSSEKFADQFAARILRRQQSKNHSLKRLIEVALRK